ncbi:hypothetical protein DYB32_006686 [Aphanomyces invadans]|uniref:Uncharacterized protein n=1 Tax=Aphanomyces invadans TaxID=157072 RepID=A0A418AQZ4_9STRA|nr:hypothetical protein DYB32_006686 [Aphanomyces invadans]
MGQHRSSDAALNRALVALPKKATLSLMDAFHAAQSPLKRPSQHTAPHSTSEPPEKKSTTNQDVPTPAAYTTSPACRKHIKQRSASDKRLQRKAVVQAIEVPPMTSSTSNGDDGGPLPKLKFDQTDWKRTSTTIKSIERGMREMRYETQFQDKQAKAMAKVLPAALPPSSVGRTASNDIAGASLPYYRALEQERFGASKRRECGLCHISHLTINLPAKVSFRCIMELYVRWGYVPPDRDSAKYRPPKCYDEVPICRFCEQIVQDVTWDPSFQKPFHSLPFVHHDDVASSGKRPSSLDPYALPPLDPDDFLSSGDDASDHEAQEQKPDVVHPDTPAKLVYRQANYLTGEKALSLNEWSVLQTSMSNIRVVMERTAKLANARNTKHL